MAIIETDNREIEKEILALERLIEQGGGGIHSKVVISDQGGSLSIKTKEDMGRGKEIIRLSRDTVLPADQYDVLIKNGKFDLKFPKNSNLSKLQRQLAESMITLYNLTDKVKLHQEFSFLLSVRDYPEIVEKLREGRVFGSNMLQWHEKLQGKMSTDEFGEFLSDSFLKTRHLGYGDHIRTSNVSILMPIVDFLNHHWQGAAFQVGLGVRKGDLAVTANQVVDGNLECYAFYSVMDAMDALLRYDFIDEYAPVVRSVPITLDVPDFGTIKVNSLGTMVNSAKLAKQILDLNRFIPTVTPLKDKKTVAASHLLIPTDGSPNALRRVLFILLANIAGKLDMEKAFCEPWIRQAEQDIVAKNNAYYNELITLVNKITQDKGASPGLERVRHLAAVQLKKLSEYKFLDTYEQTLQQQKAASDAA